MAKHALYVLENSALVNLASDKRFTSRFPFLAALQGKKPAASGGCGSCARKTEEVNRAFNAAKAQIASLNAADAAAFRELLNARKVRVSYNDGGRSLVKTI
jgi:hypothetical protein